MEVGHNRCENGAIELHLKGDVTIYNVKDVFDALTAIDSLFDSDLIVDLGEVTEIDTAGMQLLLYLQKALAGNNTLRLAEPSSSVRHIMNLLHLDEQLGLQRETG